jgi:hypothetical protein
MARVVLRRTLHRKVEYDTATKLLHATISAFSSYQASLTHPDANIRGEFFDISSDEPDDIVSEPTEWEGNVDFGTKSVGGAVETYAEDTTDGLNPCLVGMRDTARPRYWLNIKPVGIDTPQAMEKLPGRRVRWKGVWDDCNIIWVLGHRGLGKTIRVVRKEANRNTFRFSLRYPSERMTHEVTPSSLVFKDKNTNEVLFESSAPYAIDADGNISSATFTDPGPVTIGQREFPTVRIVIPQQFMNSATYPVEVDPTVNLKGTADTEDVLIFRTSPGTPDTRNWGSLTFSACGPAERGRSLFRAVTSSLPSGSVSSCTLDLWRYGQVTANTAGTLEAYQISNGNGWVEGTSTGTTESGAVNDQYVIHATQAWNSWPLASGSDYDADASPPSVAFPGITVGASEIKYTLTLPTTWPENWKSGGHDNNGVMLREKDEDSLNKRFDFRTSEYATSTYHPTLNITYTDAAGIAPIFLRHRVFDGYR